MRVYRFTRKNPGCCYTQNSYGTGYQSRAHDRDKFTFCFLKRCLKFKKFTPLSLLISYFDFKLKLLAAKLPLLGNPSLNRAYKIRSKRVRKM
jgi:hypothetical protein